jgi:hypothetical protein
MSQITITAGGTNSTLNLPNGTLPQIDPLTGASWNPQWRGPGNVSWAQPGTADTSLTAPQANKVTFRNPA